MAHGTNKGLNGTSHRALVDARLRTERAAEGRQAYREWTAIGETEVECVLAMARCLREIGAGRVPK